MWPVYRTKIFYLNYFYIKKNSDDVNKCNNEGQKITNSAIAHLGIICYRTSRNIISEMFLETL